MTTTAHEDQFTPARVEVTQADMDAAIELATIMLGNGHSFTKELATADRHFMLDAFARHRTASAPAGEVKPVAMQRTIDRLHRELSDLRTKYVDALAAQPPAPADLVETAIEMMRTAAELRASPNQDCNMVEQAIMWEKRARAALAKHGGA